LGIFVRGSGCIFALLLLSGCVGGQTSQALLEPRTIEVDAAAEPAGATISGHIRQLQDQTGPSYVTLVVHEKNAQGTSKAYSQPEALTSGSGFVVSEDLIMTAGHVAVKPGNTVDARASDGRIYSGTVIAVKPENDMALIKLRRFKAVAVKPAAQHCMQRGAPVFSLGKPHARNDTARIGSVNSMSFGRAVRYSGFGYPDAIELRLATKKGESGGPLFDDRGQLTGMLVSTLSDAAGRPLNLAHAISTPALARFLCSNTSCTSDWQQLATKQPNKCPAT
jgi:S1-C subfamily serine protease